MKTKPGYLTVVLGLMAIALISQLAVNEFLVLFVRSAPGAMTIASVLGMLVTVLVGVLFTKTVKRGTYPDEQKISPLVLWPLTLSLSLLFPLAIFNLNVIMAMMPIQLMWVFGMLAFAVAMSLLFFIGYVSSRNVYMNGGFFGWFAGPENFEPAYGLVMVFIVSVLGLALLFVK